MSFPTKFYNQSFSVFFLAKTITMNFTFSYLLPVRSPSSQHVSPYMHTVVRYRTAAIVFAQNVSVSL